MSNDNMSASEGRSTDSEAKSTTGYRGLVPSNRVTLRMLNNAMRYLRNLKYGPQNERARNLLPAAQALVERYEEAVGLSTVHEDENQARRDVAMMDRLVRVYQIVDTTRAHQPGWSLSDRIALATKLVELEELEYAIDGVSVAIAELDINISG